MYVLKVLIRLPFSFVLVLRNLIYEFWFSSRNVNELPGVAALREKGYYVFSEKLDAEQVALLRADFRKIEKVSPPSRVGQLAGRVYCHGPISELSNFYIARYRDFAEAYFGSKNIRCELTMYQRSWPKAFQSEVPGGEFHIDDNKRNLKFFIYLTHVDLAHGPFCYVPETHGFRGLTTILRWWLWEIFRKRIFLYEFGIKNLNLESKEIPIVGEPGLCFCADTTGYHRAAQLEAGEREVFVVSFTRNVIQL